ncbi:MULTISPECIES: hypothetical protein [Pseudomonas aeruginosa group]|uniref:hypothetical protein n=1 Tax=Pseudomonas aeruginosa group TaxID=136841 RepID=UPI001F1DC8C8|nr:hypothetical protein [Pseudomonas pseudonitroreducens]
MNKEVRIATLLLLAGLTVSGCSTKNYGRQPDLTDFESRTMSCREIDLEQAKVQGFLAHVQEESEFDGRSVLSFLGDFGIGNVMEKDAAIESANKRMGQLSSAKVQQGCSYASSTPPQQYSAPRAYAPATASAPVSASASTKEAQLEELSRTPMSYEEYQRRYRELMGQ